MRVQETAQFEALARDTAATVRATVKRWWLDGKDRVTLHVEAERAFVGAKPVIVHFSVPLSKTRVPTPTRPPHMEVVAVNEPAPAKAKQRRTKREAAIRKARPAARKARPAAKKTRALATKTRTSAGKTRLGARKAGPARRVSTARQASRAQKRTRAAGKKGRSMSPRR